MTTHRAFGGFDRVAGPYERGRPGYPDEAIAWLAAMRAVVTGAMPEVDARDGTAESSPEGSRTASIPRAA